uniref:Uncharacterized protein n=1 Tax=Anguilla anguilla TaxID=7936 RepID=A0A0E9X1V4_ANGAN
MGKQTIISRDHHLALKDSALVLRTFRKVQNYPFKADIQV